jgi:hypothetical protein
MWSTKMQISATPRKKSRRRSRGGAGEDGQEDALMTLTRGAIAQI